ncbi:MAG: response regulator transcription factor [Proteobacteria bacterium]|nr:response regulator transcription factor [Pseudomonadota bacterium]
MIKVMLAFSNMLFSEAISGLIEGKKKMAVVHVLKTGSEFTLKEWKKIGPHVILTDMTCLYNSFGSIPADETKLPFILLDTNCGKENIVTAILKKQVSGVLLGDSTSKLMQSAIETVAAGDIWIDKKTVKNLVFGLNALGSEKSAQLTNREKNVVDLIAKGYRNKEIAQQLNISEPTVKTHLYRIFRKLNMKNRSELITFAIKKQDMSGNFL